MDGITPGRTTAMRIRRRASVHFVYSSSSANCACFWSSSEVSSCTARRSVAVVHSHNRCSKQSRVQDTLHQSTRHLRYGAWAPLFHNRMPHCATTGEAAKRALISTEPRQAVTAGTKRTVCWAFSFAASSVGGSDAIRPRPQRKSTCPPSLQCRFLDLPTVACC